LRIGRKLGAIIEALEIVAAMRAGRPHQQWPGQPFVGRRECRHVGACDPADARHYETGDVFEQGGQGVTPRARDAIRRIEQRPAEPLAQSGGAREERPAAVGIADRVEHDVDRRQRGAAHGRIAVRLRGRHQIERDGLEPFAIEQLARRHVAEIGGAEQQHARLRRLAAAARHHDALPARPIGPHLGRLGAAMQAGERLRERRVGAEVAGIEGERQAACGDRGRVLVEAQMRGPDIVPGVGRVRPRRQHLAERCARLVGPPHLGEQHAAIVVGGRVVRVDRDRAVEGRERRVALAGLLQQGAEVIVGRREMRVERRGVPQPLDCRREVAFLLGCLAEIMPRMRVRRRECEAATQQRLRGVGVRRKPQRRKQQKRFGIFAMPSDQRLERGLRLGRPARRDVRQHGAQRRLACGHHRGRVRAGSRRRRTSGRCVGCRGRCRLPGD
jgi:hypothetical protein